LGPTRPTVGVLSTSFGGSYFGSILGGIAEAVAAVDGRMFAIQTLDAGTFMADKPEPPDFHQVAWDHISGFVVLLNAVSPRFLHAAHAAGKPVIMVSHAEPGFDCPVLIPDNGMGIRQAVSHLVGHGHRDIGFVGHITQRDILERYQEYQRSLRAHGIEPDDRLFLDSGNQQQSGGERAARTLLAAGLRSTAIVAGNDANALGIIRALQAGGLDLPRQQAVIGFDDIDSAVFTDPGLSTVRQPLAAMGAEAVTLVLRHLDGQGVPAGYRAVPTTFVARRSCGCPNTLALGGHPPTTAPPIPSGTVLAERISAAYHQPGGPATEVIERAARLVDLAVHAAAGGAAGPDESELEQAVTELGQVAPTPEATVEATRQVRRYGQSVAEQARLRGDGPAAVRVTERVLEVVQWFGQAQVRAQFLADMAFAATFGAQHKVSMDLLRSHEEDPRALAWLGRTNARAGVLGLWKLADDPPLPTGDDLPAARLELVGSFGGKASAAGGFGLGAVMTTREFPPAELIDVADVREDVMVFVASVKVGTSDWGMLAVAGPIEASVSTGRETMNQWAALLTIALDHEAVLQSLREQEERMRHAALYDQLTGLANRTLFTERLNQAIGRCRRTAYPFAVLLLDLDGFKLVNDSLGHLAGDRLLVEVASRVRATLRDVDVAARLGGDEFAVLLEGVSDSALVGAVADRLNAAIRTPLTLDDQQVVVGASIGIAHSKSDYHSATEVVRDADIAMYWAKSAGKGTYAVFDVAMHERALGRLRIEADLRHARDRGELHVHYQPIVELMTSRPVAFEALLRWEHPTLGLLLPEKFLPVAEESGLMPAIGAWTFGEACQQLAAWPTTVDGGPPLGLSVNVSNREFWSGNLARVISDWLDTTGVSATRIAIEITEGVIMHDVKLAQKIIHQLCEMGVELHVDDFGTGHSSLELLHQLPIDVLKIDRSFIARITTDSRSRELVRTIIMMGANLGLRLIAEGVESADQRDLLRGYGCGYGQGHWFSPAVPAAQAGHLLADANWR
jgi:diguanylate cyclase (GGDEF)-like protein